MDDGDLLRPSAQTAYWSSLPGIMQATPSAAGQAIGRQFKNTTTPMFSTRLNTAITVGRTHKTPRPASSPIQNTGLFASVVTASRPRRADHRSAPAAPHLPPPGTGGRGPRPA